LPTTDAPFAENVEQKVSNLLAHLAQRNHSIVQAALGFSGGGALGQT
jgi:hypothetical protein